MKKRDANLTPFELMVLAVVVCCLIFVCGYFLGSRNSVANLSILPYENRTTDASLSLEVPDVGEIPSLAAPYIDPSLQPQDTPEKTDNDSIPEENITASVPAIKTEPSDLRIDINTAGRSLLMTLPGIGEVLANRIVEYRDENGPFSSIYDLMEVSGIGEKKFEAIKDLVMVP